MVSNSEERVSSPLVADGAFLSKSILQSKLIILTSDSYEVCNCQVLQDQFHEHVLDWLYKIVLAILQRVLVTCTRVGMQVLGGSLKVQNRSAPVCQIIWLAGKKKDLLGFSFLTCQEISKDYGCWDILLGRKVPSVNFLTPKNPERANWLREQNQQDERAEPEFPHDHKEVGTTKIV